MQFMFLSLVCFRSFRRFCIPCPVLSFPWTDQPTKEHPIATVTTPDGVPFDQIRVNLYDAGTVALMVSQVTDGPGWFRFVDLNRGFSKVKVDLTRGHGHHQTVTTSLSAGRVTTVKMTPFPWRQEGNQSIHVPNGFDAGDADLLLDGER